MLQEKINPVGSVSPPIYYLGYPSSQIIWVILVRKTQKWTRNLASCVAQMKKLPLQLKLRLMQKCILVGLSPVLTSVITVKLNIILLMFVFQSPMAAAYSMISVKNIGLLDSNKPQKNLLFLPASISRTAV